MSIHSAQFLRMIAFRVHIIHIDCTQRDISRVTGSEYQFSSVFFENDCFTLTVRGRSFSFGGYVRKHLKLVSVTSPLITLVDVMYTCMILRNG